MTTKITKGKALDILTRILTKAAMESDDLRTDESAEEARLIREAMYTIQWDVAGMTSAYGQPNYEDEL